ncbi:hypothetical protein F511_22229 [Dorcoceras hygrometricum]|uniref:Uncharacterized protein n=1 Tax=Dorcoceras hygrometricum TaxID=472368 RepID=A0A2Z7CT31_9LAMI|nr:hypothetical protein F511_22229 [Dorcoceras hygrometricum]
MGLISNIGPKTSRDARDRPELNPRKQTSHHDITGASPDGGRRQQIARGRDKRGAPMRHRAEKQAEQRPKIGLMRDQLASPVRPAARNHALDTGQRSRAMRGQRAGVVRAHARGATTGRETPSSASTRSPDEISVDGFSSKN